MTALIREVASTDIDGLLALYADHRTSHLDRPMDLSRARVEAILLNPAVTIFGAFDDDRVVSSCVLHVLPSLVTEMASYALVDHLVTRPGEHNKGHRRRLIRAAGTAAMEAGCERVMLMSGPSRRNALLRELRLDAIRNQPSQVENSLTFRPR